MKLNMKRPIVPKRYLLVKKKKRSSKEKVRKKVKRFVSPFLVEGICDINIK